MTNSRYNPAQEGIDAARRDAGLSIKRQLQAVSEAEVRLVLTGSLNFESAQAVAEDLRDYPATSVDVTGLDFNGASGVALLVGAIIESAERSSPLEIIGSTARFRDMIRAFSLGDLHRIVFERNRS